MCGLCGLFVGETHWTEAAENASQPSRQARLRRVALANRVLHHYRLTLGDWEGNKYLLSSATGVVEIIDNVAALWPVAEKILKRPCDPLDPELLSSLEPGAHEGVSP